MTDAERRHSSHLRYPPHPPDGAVDGGSPSTRLRSDDAARHDGRRAAGGRGRVIDAPVIRIYHLQIGDMRERLTAVATGRSSPGRKRGEHERYSLPFPRSGMGPVSRRSTSMTIGARGRRRPRWIGQTCATSAPYGDWLTARSARSPPPRRRGDRHAPHVTAEV